MSDRPAQHAALVDEIADAIVLATVDDAVTFWNRAAEQLFGYRADEAIGASLGALIIPSERRDEHATYRQMAARGEPVVYETVRRTQAGRHVNVSISVSSVRQDRDSLAGLVYSMRDVTRLTHRREAALLAARFRGLLDAAPDSMIVVNREGYILLVNAQTEEMFGYTRDELIGLSVDTLTPARVRGQHREHRERYFAAPRTRAMGANLELYGRRNDGSEFPVEVSLTPLETELGLMTMSAIRDSTERRRAEARFRSLLEAAPDAIVIVDAAGTITLVNAQAEAMFGYPRDALVGHPVETLLPEQMRRAHVTHRQEYFAAPRTRAMGVNLELRARRRDGTEFPVEISLSPLESADGLLTISAIRDVTEQKAMAERARMLAEEQAAREQAEAAVRTRTEFLSVAAHELKTPITSLRVFANLLTRQIDERGGVNPQRLRLALDTIDQQSDKLSRLINQLLDVSRIEAGRLGLSRMRADMLALAREAAVAAQAATDRHTIVVDGVETVALVDPLRLEQVLTNLLDNAVKYSPDGGEIRVTVEQPTDDAARIVVQDQGIGISDEVRSRIFDRFYRVDEDGPTAGMGLGLFISREIIELHGGAIDVERAEGGGTRFAVTVPRHIAHQEGEQQHGIGT